MKIHSRIERLEDELLPLPAGGTLRWKIVAIGEKGEVVGTQVVEVPLPPRDRAVRRYRSLAARRDW
jgi:hypothetical protein